jgi:hypothetical protein
MLILNPPEAPVEIDAPFAFRAATLGSVHFFTNLGAAGRVENASGFGPNVRPAAFRTQPNFSAALAVGCGGGDCCLKCGVLSAGAVALPLGDDLHRGTVGGAQRHGCRLQSGGPRGDV